MNYRAIVFILLLVSAGVHLAFGHSEALGQNDPWIEIKLTLHKDSYRIGEPIKVDYGIRNVSNSSICLLPLDLARIHFNMYRGDTEVYFEHPSMPSYFDNFFELQPGQSRTFNTILDRKAYTLPSEAGDYKLCAYYENQKKSMRNIVLWVGRIESCATLKIKE